MDRASDFEMAGGTEYPFHGGKIRPSSRWSQLTAVHYEHKFHPFHPICTTVAPELHQNQLDWRLDIHYKLGSSQYRPPSCTRPEADTEEVKTHY